MNIKTSFTFLSIFNQNIPYASVLVYLIRITYYK